MLRILSYRKSLLPTGEGQLELDRSWTGCRKIFLSANIFKVGHLLDLIEYRTPLEYVCERFADAMRAN